MATAARVMGERQRGVHAFGAVGLVRHRLLVVGASIVGMVIASALLAPFLSPYAITAQDLQHRLSPPDWRLAPGLHLMGTDQLGRDICTRLLYGGRISLAVGFLAVLVSAPTGVAIGLVSGYKRGRLDEVVMRLTDIQLSIPYMLLAVTIIALLGPSTRNVILVLAIMSWPLYARMTRGEVLMVASTEFVEAARAVGASDGRTLLRHILPNALTPVVVVATFAVAQMITTESSLSFLGLGVQPPTPSWGLMLADGRSYVTSAWWLATFPGLAIAVTILGVVLLGDWLRDRFDPRRRTEIY